MNLIPYSRKFRWCKILWKCVKTLQKKFSRNECVML